MLCEQCNGRDATRHFVGWSRIHDGVVDVGRIERFERHLCETCVTELRNTDPIVNPLLILGPRPLRLTIRILSASANPDQTLVRLNFSEPEIKVEECMFLTSRFGLHGVGEESEWICDEAELEWLKGGDPARKVSDENHT